MVFFFFFKQKTAYEMRISDWSSDVCSSDLNPPRQWVQRHAGTGYIGNGRKASWAAQLVSNPQKACRPKPGGAMAKLLAIVARGGEETLQWPSVALRRSEEHTSALQSLMRISYAAVCLKQTHRLTALNRT